MKLHTLWKQWEEENVELCGALDEYTLIDAGNWDLWQKIKDDACQRYGINEVDLREVVIEVDEALIARAFLPPQVQATVPKRDRRPLRGRARQ